MTLKLIVFFLLSICCSKCSTATTEEEIYDEDSQTQTSADLGIPDASDPESENEPEQEEPNDPQSDSGITCKSSGGFAGDSGLKVWCWNDVDIPLYEGSKGVAFSNQQLKIDSECDEQQVSKAGNRLRFYVKPEKGEPDPWCSREFNMRAEFRTAPWPVNQSLGTEEWFGWNYTLGPDYKIDQENQWLFFQIHPGIRGVSPQIELSVINRHQFPGHGAGEIYVVNKGNYPDYHPTGITPEAGDRLDIVVHVVYEDASEGLLQVWINGKNVYDKKVATVYDDYPWGGNAKWGIYKWPWSAAENVAKSNAQGIGELETFMGTLKVLTRKPGEPDYLTDAYDLVVPE